MIRLAVNILRIDVARVKVQTVSGGVTELCAQPIVPKRPFVVENVIVVKPSSRQV